MLIDGLQPFQNISIGTALMIVFLLVITGKLVARRFLDDERENTKAWRAVAENNSETLVQLKHAVEESVELARTADHILREIQAARRPSSTERGDT